MNAQVEALLAERDRHVLAGRAERVEDIDAELAELGHKVDKRKPAAKK